MTARILVTRAQPGADETAEALRRRGHHPIVSPALTLAPVAPAPEFTLSGLQGLLFTSANGVRAFAERCDERALTAWCVGPATDAAAREAGFRDRRCAHGDATALAELVRTTGDPDAGALLHVANAAAAGRLAARLREAGFEVRFAPLYTPQPAQAFTPEAEAALKHGTLAGVLFHSTKGAAAFAALADAVDLSATHAVAVSEAAFAPVSGLAWRTRHIAEAPNEAALLAALETALGSV